MLPGKNMFVMLPISGVSIIALTWGFASFLSALEWPTLTRFKIAGGAKCMASPEHESEREFVLEQIRKSIRLHDTKRVILMVHSDCGAYGGLAGGFDGDSRAEAVHHEQELQRAAGYLSEAIPGIEIQGYFVDFDGIWEAEVASGSRPPQEQKIA
jgi:hypothetical protein